MNNKLKKFCKYDIYKPFITNKNNKSIIISIEGNIGLTKYSIPIINIFKKKAKFKTFSNINSRRKKWLELFYKNKYKNAFGLQLILLSDYYNQIKDLYIKFNKIIIDRSPVTSKMVFGKYFEKKKYIDKNELDLYNKYYNMFGICLKPILFIYIKKDINDIIKYLKKEKRLENNLINEEYIKKINQYYNDFFKIKKNFSFDNKLIKLINNNIFVIDGSQPLKNILKSVEKIAINFK